MSGRHTSRRRRSYGRRQHELRERITRLGDHSVWADGVDGGRDDADESYTRSRDDVRDEGRR